MKNKIKNLKYVLLLFISIIVSFTLVSYNNVEIKALARINAYGELKVHFIDVGQGDCILLQQGDSNMIIDGGTSESERVIKDYLNKEGVNKLDYVIGTHAHEDHIGSLDNVIDSYNIGEVYFPKQISTTRTFQNFIEACSRKKLGLRAPKQGDTFKLGNAYCTVLSLGKEKYKDINDSSIVLKVTFGNTSFIFTGDASKEAENEMLNSGVNLNADVLKVGHHGSKTATTDNFLRAVNPKYAVISVGKNNDYNLPTKQVIDKLKNRNIPIYRTDEYGSITAVSDGTSINFNKSSVINNGNNNNHGRIVYWTSSAKSYHYDKECYALRRSKNIKSGNINECPKTDPCNRCAK